ncbi:MAG: hypothetical protein AB4058_10180 [Microcystaceae cyanobacterium]
MFNLVDWQETQFYKDVFQEGELKGELKGEIKGKLATLPLLLKLGLTPEQIAEELNLELAIINQYIASQEN